jgi:CubicO group peptidase (beta-lactamase class C family)
MSANTPTASAVFIKNNDMRFPIAGLLWMLTFCRADAQLSDSVVKKVDMIFSKWDRTNSPGCSIAIVKDGKILYSRGYGMSNLEYSLAITPASVFHVASISKQFTAAAIQQLSLEGRLSLNDNIRKYIPEVPDFGHPITIGNLLHHTSGLRDQWDLQALAGWRDDDVIKESDILDMLKRQRDLNFLPGEEYLYCNSGFTLLGIVVKRITGVSLRKYDDSVFFRPLGMTSTVFHSDHTEIVPNRTSAYDMDSTGTWKISIPVFDNYGATSLFTTAENLAKWDENFYSKKVGGEAFITAMLTPGVLNDGKQQTYASGLALGQYKGNTIVEHSGADAGYRADILRFPDQHFSVIVLANLADINPSNLSRKVADLFITDRSPVPQHVVPTDSTVVRQWAGDYMDFHSKATTKLKYDNGRLMINAVTLISLSDSTFVNPNNGARYSFRREATRVKCLLQTAGMQDRAYEKVTSIPPTAGGLDEYAGTYHSSELDVDYSVSVKDSALSVRIPRNDPATLTVFIKDHFTGFAVVQFLRDKKNKVTGFLLSTGRAWNLYFARITPIRPSIRQSPTL